MAAITVLSVFYVQENTIHMTKKEVSAQFSNFMAKSVRHESSVISEYIRFIQKTDTIRTSFEGQNKRELYASARDIYQKLNQNLDLTHMYFIRPDGTVLLRVHDYGRDGDRIDRATFKKSAETHMPVYGLEFGIKKNYTLRVVHPWYVRGKLIGYVELGKEIDKIIEEYTSLLNTQVYMAVNKEHYHNAADSVLKTLHHPIDASDYFIAYHTGAIPEQIGAILNGSIDHGDISFEGQDYYASKMPLFDFSGKNLGYFVFLQDVSLEHQVIYGAIKALCIMLIFVSALFFFIGYYILRKKEKNINTLTSELKNQKEELLLYSVKFQKLFDLQKNIVILTDGRSLAMANRAMFDFFGFEELPHFLRHHNCICEKFIDDDNFFHLGKIADSENWVQVIKSLPQEKRIVAMLDHRHIRHVFSVAVNEFETDKYVIAFTDISSTIREQSLLLKKATHDTLTGAFNREFLENTIDQILSDAMNQNLGVIMCDIDHFKRVNDTYGHHRGDEVLKTFVTAVQRSIRSEDYLIRWGGEEFIILMKVDSIESLHKATENIRQTVEKLSFEDELCITSSFGITLHHHDEGLFASIARADNALYAAKEYGRNRVISA